jgi:hypothetical protein
MSTLPPANPYAVPQAAAEPAGDSRFQYRPLGGRAIAVAIPLGVYVVFAVLAIVLGVGPGSSGQSWSEAWADESPMTTSDYVEGGEGMAMVATIIVLCFFLPQANRNARALTGGSMRFSPASTMWWFFVPIMMFFRPYQAVREIWQSSTAPPERNFTVQPAPSWLRLWWGTWLVFNILGSLTEQLAKRGMPSSETFSLVVRLCGIVAAVCLIYTVRRIASAQAKRASGAADSI